MPIKDNYNTAPEKDKKSFGMAEKFLAGCSAIGGKPVKEIAEETGMSREYVYQQKEFVCQHAQSLDSAEPDVPVLRLDKRAIERSILSLTLDCQSPISGIQRFFLKGHLGYLYQQGISAM
jgi:hypothetical protein